ncbi:hypothetical protein GX51_02755 [Blastomyces parvus]|uniref:Uncharacterized protein n=1 Tax=Blastomyces parvus TaxID=2060905 RepID=A0A2B7X2B9_9EURO|nr:hypothetical protein GX51_02755 [Blastomyces parvus]
MTSQLSSRTSNNSHHPATTVSAIDTKTPASSRPSNPEHGHRHSSSATGTSPSTSRWQPKLNRTQSCNEQDMKHQMQQRLTGLEKGRESGFTESEREARDRDGVGQMGEGMNERMTR